MRTSFPKKVYEAMSDYVKIVDATHGACLDLAAAQVSHLARLDKLNVLKRPGVRLHYGKGDPNVLERENRWQQEREHSVLATELYARNQPRAANQTLVGNMSLVYIYQVWEEQYRPSIAEGLGYTNPTDLKVPVMGDIRHYRISIIHRLGTAMEECDRCTVLRWFKSGERISVTADMLWEAKIAIHAALGGLITQYIQEDRASGKSG